MTRTRSRWRRPPYSPPGIGGPAKRRYYYIIIELALWGRGALRGIPEVTEENAAERVRAPKLKVGAPKLSGRHVGAVDPN